MPSESLRGPAAALELANDRQECRVPQTNATAAAAGQEIAAVGREAHAVAGRLVPADATQPLPAYHIPL